jgi:hypothetical protein
VSSQRPDVTRCARSIRLGDRAARGSSASSTVSSESAWRPRPPPRRQPRNAPAQPRGRR